MVARDEAYARVQATVDVRNEKLDIWILARTDSLIHGYDEAIARAKRFKEIGADCIFVEALPDLASMQRLRNNLDFPVMGNIIEGSKTENLSAKNMADLGYAMVCYPWTLVAARLRNIRETLENLKCSIMIGNIEL